MSNVLERLRKKRGSKVTINGEDFYVRPLTLGELRRLEALTEDDKTGFVVGCTLCVDQNGEPELPQLPGECDQDWAARVLDALSDVPTDYIRELSDGVAAIGRPPKMDAVVKN